jgi:hypothetical protein
VIHLGTKNGTNFLKQEEQSVSIREQKKMWKNISGTRETHFSKQKEQSGIHLGTKTL